MIFVSLASVKDWFARDVVNYTLAQIEPDIVGHLSVECPYVFIDL